MKRHLRAFALPVLFSALSVAAQAQAPAPGPGGDSAVLAEVRSLKRLVELQTKELNSLAEQVARLRQRMETHEIPAVEASAAPLAPEPPGASAPAPALETAAPAPAPAPAAAADPHAEAEAPRAVATGGGIKHLVAKGETLTSIAKHYNVHLLDLQKANKGLEARKMQIGQVLNIPASATVPAPETAVPTEIKETP